MVNGTFMMIFWNNDKKLLFNHVTVDSKYNNKKSICRNKS